MSTPLTHLETGMPIVYGGDRMTTVPEDLARAFAPGDAVIVVEETGELLHLHADARTTASEAVGRAVDAFAAMGAVDDDQVTRFFEAFASALEDDRAFSAIAAANRADVDDARRRGRSTTRLELTARMRTDMVDGLRVWRDHEGGRGRVLGTRTHDGWEVEEVVDGLGVVGFVFEGRPNVFADATGVLRGGNTVVFRIGRDALGTARAIMRHALDPALEAAGLPVGAASLVDDPSHAAGWAMMGDPRLALAVARGSGPAVRQLGAVARQAGNPVSLHGTGGAWIVAADDADPGRFAAVVEHSLDRKVCNTLNTCVIVEDRADDLVPVFLDALEKAGARRGAAPKLHVLDESLRHVPAEWFDRTAVIARADGAREEPQAQTLERARLGDEWEWEDSPEVTLAVAPSVEEAVAWFGRYSPRFIASLISEDPGRQRRFFESVDAPFVGDGFTRWVDGQYALDAPELGLSNWEHGRLFGRGGILSGDSVFTVRLRARQERPDVRR